jgi:hypothetical protein
MIGCQQIQASASRLTIVIDCALIGSDILRVTTTFRYPDGSYVDLFVKETPNELFHSYVLTDMGSTTAYLLDMNLRAWKTSKRRNAVGQICKVLGVSQDGGALQVLIKRNAEDFGSAVLRLAQACIRVSDLALTYTIRSVSAFKDDVEEFLDSTGFEYKVDPKFQGQFGKEVRIDFQIYGPRQESLVQAITAANSVVANRVADDSFTRWYDIKVHRSGKQFITVYDSIVTAFDPTDLLRLEDLSIIVGFPDQQEILREVLAA